MVNKSTMDKFSRAIEDLKTASMLKAYVPLSARSIVKKLLQNRIGSVAELDIAPSVKGSIASTQLNR